MTTMKQYYYATGRNGSVLVLDDGRYADTVDGCTSEPEESHEAMDRLNKLVEGDDWQPTPTPFGEYDSAQMAEYVGNDDQEDPTD